MPDREIKTTLTLTGENTYKKAISESASALKSMGLELKLNASEADLNGKSLDGLKNRASILGKEIEKQKQYIDTLNKAIEASTKAYGADSKVTQEYKDKLTNASIALNKMEGEAKSTNKEIENFGKKTEDAAKKTTTWKEKLESLNKGLQSGIKFLTPVAAGIAATGAAAVASTKQLFDLTAETGVYVDALATTSAQTGVAVSTLQEWEYASRFIDTSVETMTGSMAKMIKQMDAVFNGSEDCKNAFGELNVTIADANGMRDSEDVFADVIDALGQISNETERDALSMQIFGKSAQELNPLIEAGSARLRELGQEAQNAGLVLDQTAINGFQAFDDSMQKLDATFDGAKRQIAEALLPAFQAIIPVVQQVAASFMEWLRSDGAQALIQSLTEKIQGVVSWLQNNLASAIQTVIGVFGSIISTIGWVIDNFGTLVTVGGVVTGMLTALKIAQAAVNIVMAANPIGIIILAIAALVAAIVVLIQNWDKVKAAITRVWDSIKSAVSAGVEAIKGAFSAVIQWFSSLVTGVYQAGVNIVKGIWEGIKSATTWLWNKIKGWVHDALGWIADLLGIHSPSTVMRDMIGKNMVKGMADGITGNANMIDKAMSGLVPDATTASVAMNVTRRFNDVAGGAVSYGSSSSRNAIDYDRLAAAVSKSMPQQEIVVTMDGKKIGYGTAKYVSEAQGNAATSLQRSGFRADVSVGLA